MSLLRTIGYLGLAMLLVVGSVGAVLAAIDRDWYGVAAMIAFCRLLAFFAHGLRSAAKRESDPEARGDSSLGWDSKPVSALFRGPIRHTPQGLVLVGGSVASLLFAVLAWFVPSSVALNPSRSSVNTMLFGMWPLALFVIYVSFCAPHFQPSKYASLVMVCAAAFPFYLAYR